MPGPRERRRRADIAYESVRSDLLEGRWPAGTLLSTYALSEELSMSRTPIAEALKRLDSEGLVEIVPQVGCRVVAQRPEDLFELGLLLGAVEGVAAELASRALHDDELTALDELITDGRRAVRAKDTRRWSEIDQRFRDLVVDAAGGAHLSRVAGSLRATLDAVAGAGTILVPRNLRTASTRQQAIVAALRARDAGEARSLMEEHVVETVTRTDGRAPAASDSATAAGAGARPR